MRELRSSLKSVATAVALVSSVAIAVSDVSAATITVGSGTAGGAPNTGVMDPNLRVVEGPDNGDFTNDAFNAAVATLNGGGGTQPFLVHHPAWTGLVPGTEYVNPVSGGASNGSTGAYLATFTLPAFSTASLGMDFYSDDFVNGFLLNGNAISTPGPGGVGLAGGFSGPPRHVDVTNSGFFAVGENRLIFRAFDQNGPAGFDFLATVTFSPAAIPEPSTYALMLAGLGFVGFIAHRRRKTHVAA